MLTDPLNFQEDAMRKPMTLIAALIACAFLANAQAADSKAPKAKRASNFVTAQQLETVKAGQTKEEVIQALGKPLSQPKWRNGTQSLVYKTKDGGSYNALAYIDVDSKTGTVISYIIRPDESSGSGDSGGGGAN
jgi:outer membrane protein assembly factor BamE (lipoprotein component of BamABCDE complex)